MTHKIVRTMLRDDVIARFHRGVSYLEGVDACWEWRGRLDKKGYGVFHVANLKYGRTHRIAYLIAVGDIDDGLSICHKCDNRKCVRPDHLFLGTNEDNTRDMVEKGRNKSWMKEPGATRGENSFRSKLTDDLVVSIRRRIRNGEMGKDVARELGISHPTLSEAKCGRLWSHVDHIEPPLAPWSRRPLKTQ